MDKRSTKIFLRLSIVVMVILLVVPCSLKREYKQTFDIPLSEAPISAQSIHAYGCSLISRTSTPTKRSLKKKHVRPLLEWIPSIRGIEPQKHYSSTPFGKHIRTTVPIYILHEQYLI